MAVQQAQVGALRDDDLGQVGQVWWPVEQWVGRPDPQLVAGADVVVVGQQLQPDAAAVAGVQRGQPGCGVCR